MPTAEEIMDEIMAGSVELAERRPALSQAMLVARVAIAIAMGAGGDCKRVVEWRARNAAVMELAKLFPGCKMTPCARRIASAVLQYHAAGWKKDSRIGARPDDPLKAAAFNFLRHSRPLSEHMIRKILNDAANRTPRDYQRADAA
jgi:hypothetical protein